jgi:hypothetical protein
MSHPRILAAISAADRALCAPADDVSDPVPHAGGVLLALLDEWRSAPAELGAS